MNFATLIKNCITIIQFKTIKFVKVDMFFLKGLSKV